MTSMIFHVILGLLLLLIPAGALYWLDRRLLRSLLIAVGRMTLQLFILCLVVWGLYRVDSLWLSLLWMVLLAVASGGLLLKRASLDLHHYLLPASAGLFLSALLTAAWLLLVAQLTFNVPLGSAASLVEERSTFNVLLVPVSALLLGHSLTAVVRGLKTFDTALQTDRQQYEFLRAGGASPLQAVLPFVRRSLQAVLAPTVANLSAMGLFTMPLLLCGILLGGVAPLNAFVATLLLTVGCIAASVLALLAALFLSDTLKTRSGDKQI